ncbi:MAG: TlpA family protein disulfide reductase [Pleurocapsa minor GSE-CHR-MK-17-07R]|nr:TlpA family protein disulfide reductase [Pleurocapsa minor GSE-CHR-MK 17-07R]
MLTPSFSMTALDGSPVSLNQYAGQWAIVNFWATWCVPCVEELPLLLDYAVARDIPLLAVNMRESPADIRAFLSGNRLEQLTVLTAPPNDVLVAYQVIGLPQTLLIDPNGAIAWRAFGPLNDASLDELDTLTGYSPT